MIFEEFIVVLRGLGIETFWDAAVLVLPVLLFPLLLIMARSTWLYWRQQWFQSVQKYKVFEIKIPRLITRGPKAMEQVLRSIHSMRNAPGDLGELYYWGETTRSFALELVGFAGQIHLYIRFYHQYEGLVKAAFASYYQDVELVEIEDYCKRLPQNLTEMERMNYDIWGSEMQLRKPAAYPIKTFNDFEVLDEQKWIDPMGAFFEVLAQLKPGEVVGIQLLLQPATDKWRDKYGKVIAELKQKVALRIRVPNSNETKVEFRPTPGETNVIEAIEKKLAQPAFLTYVRFIYLSPRATFYDSFARRGITGSFNQYAALDLNGFKQNLKVSTRTKVWNFPFVFPGLRNIIRKQRLLDSYLTRDTQPETFMGRLISSHLLNWNFHSKAIELTVDEVATLFHPPSDVVLTAPHIERIESRKGAPQSGLEIFGNEEEISEFS